MKLKSLQIMRMPGFEQVGLKLDNLCDGLNVIYGQNGSGKTTAAHAIRGTLWPSSLSKDCFNIVDSCWKTEGGEISIGIEGNNQRFRDLTAGKSSLELPPDYIAGCFTITVDDLYLETNGSEQILFAELRKQLAGGFDIGLLKSQLAGGSSERKVKNLATQINEASKDIIQEIGKQRNLERKQSEIKALENKLEQIRYAKGEISKIRQLKELHQLQHRRGDLLVRIQSFPEGMEYFSENDFHAINEIEQSIQQLKADLLSVQSEKEKLNSQLASHPQFYLTVDDLEVVTQREKLKRLSELTLRYDEARFSKERLDGEIAAIKDQGGWAEDVILEKIEVSLLQQAEELESRNKVIEEKLCQITARIEVSRAVEGDVDENTLEKGAKLIGELLQSRRLERLPLFKSLKLLVLAGPIFGMILGILFGSYWAWSAGGAFFILSLLVLLWGYDYGYRRPGRERADLIRAYCALEMPQPGSWEVEPLEDLLQALDLRKAKLKNEAVQAEERKRLEAEKQQMTNAKAGLDKEKQALLLKVGVIRELPFSGLGLLLKDCLRVREVSVNVRAEAKKLALILEEIEQIAADLRAFISQFEISELKTASEILAAFDLVLNRVGEVRRISEKTEDQKRQSAFISRNIEQREAQQTAIFQRLRVEKNERERLQRLLDCLPTYREISGELKHIELTIKEYESNVDLAENRIDADSMVKLEQRMQELELLVVQEEEVIRDLGSIAALVDAAKMEHRLEEAYARRNKVEVKLQGEYEQYCFQACLDYWQDVLEEVFVREAQPELVREASRLFLKFTNERFSLGVNAGGEGSGVFAFDHQIEKRLGLSGLSRGTRMQLMIALRLAFLEREEKGLKLPLILDEVLNSSDPDRFQAVAKVIAEIIRTGRQIHYFTCLPADAEALERVVADAGLEVRRIELGDGERNYTPGLKRKLGIPAPEGKDLGEYLEMVQISPINMKQGGNAVHIGYLCDSSESLYRLLQAGIKTFGQFEMLVRDGGYRAFLDEMEKARIIGKAKVYEELFQSQLIGRSRELTPELIRDACDGSDKVEELIAKAGELNWDVRKFLVEIDPDQGRGIKRLKRAVFEKLQERINQEGLMTDEQPLTADEIKSRVFAAVSSEIQSGTLKIEEVSEIIP